MSQKRLFGAITKVQKQDDGTLFIEGVASSEVRDDDGEVITADAMRASIPGYLRADGTGPVREMHQLKAAGKTVEVFVDDDDRTQVRVLVVDAEAVKKVETGVYQGFSVGGRALKRDANDKSVITEFEWNELSLVDRGANPEATFTIVKIQKEQAMAQPTVERPMTKIAALVTQFSKGKLSIDDAEKQIVDVAKAVGVAGSVIRKGMYQVARAAELFDGLTSLHESCKWEAEYEGDASKVPGMVKDACQSFAAALKALLDEEVSEALAEDDAEKVAKASATSSDRARAAGAAATELGKALRALEQTLPRKTAKAAGAEPGKEPAVTTPPAASPPAAEPQSEVEKALAAFKTDLEGQLAKARQDLEESRKAQAESHDALEKALATRSEIENRTKADDEQAKAVAEAVAKLQKQYADEIAKVQEQASEIRKIGEAATDAAKRANEINQQLVDELAKRPKGVLRAIPVSKAADNGGNDEPGEDPVEKLQKAALDPNSSEEARAAARRELVKLSHSRPTKVG